MMMYHPKGVERNRRMRQTKVREENFRSLNTTMYNITCLIASPMLCVLTENTEVKLKELLSGLSSLTLSEAEAVSVIALLREKSPSALDAWHKVRDEYV